MRHISRWLGYLSTIIFVVGVVTGLWHLFEKFPFYSRLLVEIGLGGLLVVGILYRDQLWHWLRGEGSSVGDQHMTELRNALRSVTDSVNHTRTLSYGDNEGQTFQCEAFQRHYRWLNNALQEWEEEVVALEDAQQALGDRFTSEVASRDMVPPTFEADEIANQLAAMTALRAKLGELHIPVSIDWTGAPETGITPRGMINRSWWISLPLLDENESSEDWRTRAFALTARVDALASEAKSWPESVAVAAAARRCDAQRPTLLNQLFLATKRERMRQVKGCPICAVNLA